MTPGTVLRLPMRSAEHRFACASSSYMRISCAGKASKPDRRHDRVARLTNLECRERRTRVNLCINSAMQYRIGGAQSFPSVGDDPTHEDKTSVPPISSGCIRCLPRLTWIRHRFLTDKIMRPTGQAV